MKRTLASVRALLLPSLYELPEPHKWDLFVDYTMDVIWLRGKDYGQLIQVANRIDLEEEGLTAVAANFKDIAHKIRVEWLQKEEQKQKAKRDDRAAGNPFTLIPRLGAEIVALINSRPSTPTADEIEKLIKTVLDADYEAGKSLASLDKPRDLKLSSAATRGEPLLAETKTVVQGIAAVEYDGAEFKLQNVNMKLAQAMGDSIYDGKTKDAYWAAKLNDCQGEYPMPMPYKDVDPSIQSLMERIEREIEALLGKCPNDDSGQHIWYAWELDTKGLVSKKRCHCGAVDHVPLSKRKAALAP